MMFNQEDSAFLMQTTLSKWISTPQGRTEYATFDETGEFVAEPIV